MTQQHDTTDPIFKAIADQQAARTELLAASKALDRAVEAVDAATEKLAHQERRLLATPPKTMAGAAALLTYLATVIELHEDIAPLALPALTSVREVLVQ